MYILVFSLYPNWPHFVIWGVFSWSESFRAVTEDFVAQSITLGMPIILSFVPGGDLQDWFQGDKTKNGFQSGKSIQISNFGGGADVFISLPDGLSSTIHFIL